jgi:hypothetical protein
VFETEHTLQTAIISTGVGRHSRRGGFHHSPGGRATRCVPSEVLGWCIQSSIRRHRRIDFPSWGGAALQRLRGRPSQREHRVFPRSPSTLGPRGPGPWSSSLDPSFSPLVADRVALVAPELSLPYRVFPGDHSSTVSPFTRSARPDAVPLMGFRSLQRSPARRSRLTRRFPTVGTLRPQGSVPLSTPCSPSSLPVVADQAAPGIPTFRASFLPEIRRSFELTEPS